MPLRNRLDEVIKRYDQAVCIVTTFKDGGMSEEELVSKFQRLHKERRSINEHNRAFLVEERKTQWGEAMAEEYENMSESDGGGGDSDDVGGDSDDAAEEEDAENDTDGHNGDSTPRRGKYHDSFFHK